MIRFLNIRNTVSGDIYPLVLPPSLATRVLDFAKKRKASGDIYVAKNELAGLVSLKKAVRHLSDEAQKREASKDVEKKLVKDLSRLS